MAEKFKNFYINHVLRQQNAHAYVPVSLVASLALSARATEKILVHICDLCCQKFALEDSITSREDLQVKKVLETSTSPEPKD